MITTNLSYSTRVFDQTVSLSEPDTLSMQRYFDSWSGTGYLQPEKRLMFAVLLDAVECFQKYPFARGNKSSGLLKDAEEWIFEDDHDWPFSFINICDIVEIDPHYLRKGLSRWRQRAIREPILAGHRFFNKTLG